VILFPAIDLKDGQCVRLKQGEMSAATVFNADPAGQAKLFAAQGFTYPTLAVRDLYLSLQTKPFVLLSGLSGTGKTRLTSLFAEALTGDVAAQYRLLPVRPDWAERMPNQANWWDDKVQKGRALAEEINVLSARARAAGFQTTEYILNLAVGELWKDIEKESTDSKGSKDSSAERTTPSSGAGAAGASVG